MVSNNQHNNFSVPNSTSDGRENLFLPYSDLPPTLCFWNVTQNPLSYGARVVVVMIHLQHLQQSTFTHKGFFSLCLMLQVLYLFGRVFLFYVLLPFFATAAAAAVATLSLVFSSYV